MLLIISKVIVVFIYIGVGFAANKLKVLPNESEKYFIDLIMEITAPCLMISSITGQEIEGSMLRNTIITFVLTSLLYVVIAVFSTFIADRIFKDKSQPDRNILASAMTGCNSGFMGYPIAKAVFGNQVFYYLVIQTISNNLYLFVMSIAHLHHGEKSAASSRNWRDIVKPLLNATTIATVVAIAMLFSGIRMPDYLMDIFSTIGDVTIPLSMIVVGVKLGGANFRQVFSDRDLLITSVLKLTAAPALVTLLVTPLPVDPVVKLIAVLGTSFPSAVIGVAVSAREKMNSQLMAEAVANSTLLSMLTLPIWIMICSHLYL